ncbi:long-chain fatty acid transport protein [Vibrio ishigakensis]|uniref:Long-chain fatty acid transport protein n=1 Tax=Vibrio ishigakensis TaxID=1481914 RepID=A0A0B8QDP4_9VIBR|nr:long-chain fatty acid transport protein [Vibrio ishigakensis]
MNKKLLTLALTSAFSANVFAGGILLHEVATFDSVSSAGVSNPTNRTDASAAITSPAGLTAIGDYSFSVGLQYLDAYSEQNGVNALGNPVSTSGENQSPVPSLAYAYRLNQDWVIAASLHGDGGLGMDYENGRSGIGIMDEESQEALNVHFATAYQASPNLSVGGALVVQHLMTSVDLSLANMVSGSGDEGNTAVSFILSGMYDLTKRTYIGINYKHKVDHSDKTVDVNLSNGRNASVDVGVNWPSRLDLGISHKLTEKVTLKAMTGVEFWSDFSDALDANDIYTLGGAAQYQHNGWTYQAGLRYDSAMFDTDKMVPELAIAENWSFGLGAEKARSNSHRIGLAYEYRNLGTHDVTYSIGDVPYFDGRMDEQRIHVLSLSYAY